MATIVAQPELQDGSHSPAAPSPSGRSAVWASWGAHWPLTVLFLGFPLWWVLGLRTLMPMALAMLMADQLLRRKKLSLPGGFAIWALFLAWVAVGVFVLWADAPGAVPGGGASRLFVFAYRAMWYFTGTVMMLWVANLRESELPSRWLFQLLGFMFVVSTLGGLLGVLVPTFGFNSIVELLLPHSIRANSLVQAIAHPAAADIENVLGRPEARPKAPFAFANSWGSSMALYLPFFLVSWWRDGARWQRVLVPVVLVASSVPIVYSLNRGLWICLGLGAAGYLVLQIRRAKVAPLLIALTLLAVVTIAFFASPLGTIFQERLAHAHSNERRSQLLVQTVVSAAEGSPVIGFGSTRNVQGSFSSIAGADTPDCSACGLPPLGTQGHLWLLIFSQGLVGTVLFLGFFWIAFLRCWRCRTTAETLCTFMLVFFVLQLFIYDILGLPLITVMIAIGLVWREQKGSSSGNPDRHDAFRALGRLRAVTPFLMVLTLVGAAIGAGFATRLPSHFATTTSVMLNDLPVALNSDNRTSDGTISVRSTTVDTEAAMITSFQTLSAAAGTKDATVIDDLRTRVSVTAAPNTKVLLVQVRDHDAATSRRLTLAVVGSYLQERNAQLAQRQTMALAAADSVAAGTVGPVVTRTSGRAGETIPELLVTPRTAGRVVGTSPTKLVRRDVEVPIGSGAALGLALGALLLAARPDRTPGLLTGRRRSRGGGPAPDRRTATT